MKRLVEHDLKAWKEAGRRKPLLVRGARQVGKTYSIKRFGKECFFDKVVTVDLEKNPEWHSFFEGNLDVRAILARLELAIGVSITPGQTLLFLDEIQACPRAITSLRYFYEDIPKLHVIAAGSLLDFVTEKISFPVGRIQFLEVHPMNFAEFLWALGKDKAAAIVMSRPEKLSDFHHSFLLDQLKTYFFVGGMPEAVLVFRESGSLRESFAVHKEICHSYRQDFAKVAPRTDPAVLDAVFQGGARSTGGQIKYSSLCEGHTNPKIHRAFDLLCKARVISRVPSANPSGLPLGASASAKKFKALLLDIGLCQHLCGMNAQFEYEKSELLSIYKGALAEQFVGQEMRGTQDGGLFYWARQRRGSTAEVDYLAVIGGNIHAVEVKSGAAGRLRSLHFVLEKYPNLAGGLVFSSATYAQLPERKLTFLPIYYAGSATGPI